MYDELTPDARRLLFLMNDVEAFGNVKMDRHEYASVVAQRNGRSEPELRDELDGFRMLIDAAVEGRVRRTCNACYWTGPASDTAVLSGHGLADDIGPLCPLCHETTDTGPEAKRAQDERLDRALMDQEQSDGGCGWPVAECGCGCQENAPARERVLRDALASVLGAVYACGDFNNGVTDSTGTTDEGSVRAWEIVRHAQSVVDAAKP